MVIATIRPKYACPTCQEGVLQAPAPAHLIEGGLPTEATPIRHLGAHVLVGKFTDHLPLYRQAQIYSRHGIEFDRSTLAALGGLLTAVPSAIGIGRSLAARPSHTTGHTGPYHGGSLD